MVEDLDEPTYTLLFGVRRSVRYHLHRRRFCERWSALTIIIGVVGGTAASSTAAVDTLKPDWLPILFGGLVALASIGALAFGTTRLANLHTELAREFVDLESRFDLSQSLSAQQLNEFTRERLRIEAKEPPVLRLLDLMCHFEILKSLGDVRELPRLRPWPRATIHVFSHTRLATTLANQEASGGA